MFCLLFLVLTWMSKLSLIICMSQFFSTCCHFATLFRTFGDPRKSLRPASFDDLRFYCAFWYFPTNFLSLKLKFFLRFYLHPVIFWVLLSRPRWIFYLRCQIFFLVLCSPFIIIYLFIFAVLGLELRPTPPAHFSDGCFGDRV
jgi:hypothetical protein